MREVELHWLYECATGLPPGACWVEVGTWKGRSACAVVHGLPDGATFVAVDTWHGSRGERKPGGPHYEATLPGDRVFASWKEAVAALRRERPGVRIETCRGDSARIAQEFRRSLRSADVVFLDGDHSWEGCAADIAAWRGCLQPHGFLCGHDYRESGVGQAVREAFGHRVRLVGGGTDIWRVRRE